MRKLVSFDLSPLKTSGELTLGSLPELSKGLWLTRAERRAWRMASSELGWEACFETRLTRVARIASRVPPAGTASPEGMGDSGDLGV